MLRKWSPRQPISTYVIYRYKMAARDGGDMALNDFLEAQGLLSYANKFEEIGARKMEDLIDLDIDILTGDIGISKLEGKRFLRKLSEIFVGTVSSVCNIIVS